MKKPKHIIIDVIESEPKEIYITLQYEKTLRQFAFLVSEEEYIPDRVGKRYIFNSK